jgi:hypothetical protein
VIFYLNKELNILINKDKENNTNKIIHYITQINTFYKNSKNIKNNSKLIICIILPNNQSIKNKDQFQNKYKISLLKVNIKYNKPKIIVNLNPNN